MSSLQEEEDRRLAVALQVEENLDAYKQQQLLAAQGTNNDDGAESFVSALEFDNEDWSDGDAGRARKSAQSIMYEEAQGRTFAVVAASAATEYDKQAAKVDAAQTRYEPWPTLQTSSQKMPPRKKVPAPPPRKLVSTTAWRDKNTYRERYWYDIMDDVRGGDPIFRALLGHYGDMSLLTLDAKHLPSMDCMPTQPMYATSLAAAASAGATETSFLKDSPQQVLNQFCERMYRGVRPEYVLVEHSKAEAMFESFLCHSSNEQILATGKGKTLVESQDDAAQQALHVLSCPLMEPSVNAAQRAETATISFRGAVTLLPFAVRFQLERALLSDHELIPLKLKKRPRSSEELKTLEVNIAARKMLLGFLQVVLPCLLKIQWTSRSGVSHQQVDAECANTLQELFAFEIWDSFTEVKKRILKGEKLLFYDGRVQDALQRARKSLQRAEVFCGVTELELSANNNFDVIQKRSHWPYAEFRCKFELNGQLIPTDYEVINKDISSSKITDGAPSTTSRRVFREGGWPVRDRFILISGLKFYNVFRTDLVKWVTAGPKLCCRKYAYLLDKGTGKPNLWLYSAPDHKPWLNLSRNSLLNSLGDFEQVKPEKLGDRISLAFTQTTPLMQLSMDDIVNIDEIFHHGYMFSDGCGVMGCGIAEEVQRIFCLEEVPGAIQVRMGGVKGMLSLKNDFPSHKIGIRPSMVKFPSNHMILEVKRVASASRKPENKLFNQILLIMHDLGVPNRVFFDLQAKACAEMAFEYDPEARLKSETKVDVAEYYKYMRQVVKYGQKEDGEAFSRAESQGLRKLMMKAKTKVNLRCSLVLMLGVLDEHNLLDEGEVLVGNGSVQGAVLICRSPCNVPGDIQRAYAVTGKSKLSHLKDVLVFSAKGERPLPDKLAGGDLDGDEFYIIDEPSLVGMLSPAKASDFGSQKANVETRIDVLQAFSVPSSVSSPSLTSQLRIFQKLIELGDIVAESSDAWMRVADVEGSGSNRALQMARLCQSALDARKLADKLDLSEIDEMRKIRKSYSVPHWRGGKFVERRLSSTRLSSSILGKLHDAWRKWTDELARAERRHTNHSGLDHCDTDTVVSVERECIVCCAEADRLCSLCDVVWFCSNECGQKHWIEARHNNRGLPSLKVVPEHSKDANGLNKLSGMTALNENAIDILTDIAFGRASPNCASENRINYKSLSRADLYELANLTQIEFLESLKGAINEDRGRSRRDSPHAFDVFLMDIGSYRQGGDLAVCRPEPGGGDLVWFNKDGNFLRFDEVKWERRVASLSGPSRTLEGLLAEPVVGSLMYHAMKRTMLMDVVESSNVIDLEPSIIRDMNESQRQVVATVMSPTFKSGFLAVQGPPGTGKTTTIVGIISAIGKGVLVTAPSNAAVANLALSLVAKTNLSISDVVVWGENCDDSVKFLNPFHRNNRYLGFLNSYKTTSDKEEQARKLRSFTLWLHQDTESMTLEKVSSLCCQGSDDKFDERQNLLASAKVVLFTLNTAGSTSLRRAARQKFDLLLLDEAGQCPESEFYIATSFPGVKRIVIVGDPQQLPATVVHQGCQEAGYGESFLSHLLEYRPNKVHLLNTQYRIDPKILQFSNESFYDNRIVSAKSVHNRLPLLETPFLFVDTMGIAEETKQRFSSINLHEALVIKSILRNDKDIIRLQESCTSIRTIVITPYLAQAQLLRKELKKITSLRAWDVATVDSFQGQEGDIVIVSTVRTKSVGFTDDAHRLNVALTRAKRILRVVGDADFFLSLGSDSVLRQLAAFAKKMQIMEVASITGPWRPPDWRTVTKWKPTMTSTFHHCLKNVNRLRKNVAFNTLIAIATPDLKQLKEWPTEKGPPRWQLSTLSAYTDNLYIVWVAKIYEWDRGAQADEHYVGKVEAHFAGPYKKCLQFTQANHIVPKFTCKVKRDMSLIVANDDATFMESSRIDLSWSLTNDIQDAVIYNKITDLPEGLFLLDPSQERVITRTPPLLLESRSGTGKTNVLFQHAVSYSRSLTDVHHPRPICFVTVSPRLRQELQRRYKEIEDIAKVVLPPILFYSLSGLLAKLLPDVDVSAACNFLQYTYTRKSHEKLAVEPSLVEAEIGGVIVGSLRVATQGAPLSRKEYLLEKRSNVLVDTKDGKKTRNLIYDEYECYRNWKISEGKYDISDLILKLIGVAISTEYFQSVYLDEVQDFSYASIYLICSIAGKAGMHWVAAGDTAQMISPGCSFNFGGMKQTLLAIRGDAKLGKVEQLKKNYRMTKGVLDVGNAILRLLKRHFPHAIEYAQPEEAMKDLGLTVVLVDWEQAFKQKASFGTQQAIIYSAGTKISDNRLTASNSSDHVAERISGWLGNHPFILTALDAKGLEFDDCVVAFDFERKAWQIENKSILCLRMLRELYVAITRARRRVVVLIKNSAMKDFFESLEGCTLDKDLSDGSVISLEFERETTAGMWFERGTEFFQNEQYKLAASCFNSADNFGWSNFAHGRHLIGVSGRNLGAKSAFRTAAKIFLELSEYKYCLEVMKEIRMIPPWDAEDNDTLDAALEKCPDYLPRPDTVEFALVRDRWNVISIIDLKARSTSYIFLKYRDHPRILGMIESCSTKDRQVVEGTLPSTVGDYYLKIGNLPEAIRLFIRGRDKLKAVQTTIAVVDRARITTIGLEDLLEVVKSWGDWREGFLSEGTISILVLMFESPRKAAVNHATECMQKFGPTIVKFAVGISSECSYEALHKFDRKTFRNEIFDALQAKHNSNLIEVVRWFFEQADNEHATDFALTRLKQWSDDEILLILGDFALRPTNVINELLHRSLAAEVASACLKTNCWDLDFAAMVSNQALASPELSDEHTKRLLKVWNSRRNDGRVKTWRMRNAASSMPLLLNLFDDPKTTGKTYGGKCMLLFGEAIVKDAVLSGSRSDEENYDVLCLFHKTKFMSFKPKDKKAANTQRTTTESFRVGERVEIIGLKSSTHLNGKVGTISQLVDSEGRYGVKIDFERVAKAVKPANIRKITNHQQTPTYESDSSVSAEELFDSSNSDSSGYGSLPGLMERHTQAFKNSESESEDNLGGPPPLSSGSEESDGPPPLAPRRVSIQDSSSDGEDSEPPSLLSHNAMSSDDESEEYPSFADSRAQVPVNNGSVASSDSDMPVLMDPDNSSDESSFGSSDSDMAHFFPAREVAQDSDDDIPNLLPRAGAQSSSDESSLPPPLHVPVARTHSSSSSSASMPRRSQARQAASQEQQGNPNRRKKRGRGRKKK